MGKIKQLPPHEAHKIAAGEVVDRPANVVKELIENSIDAGAQSICLYLERSGHNSIRVVDNGYGMDQEDAELCFAHHATSKISSVEQLYSLQSFGFRGEALTSIAAVSKVTLITKEQHAHTGIKLERTNNIITSCQEVSCTSGTDITVQDLFYNVPARKKFLKKEQTELRNIVQLFHAFCFDYPKIQFKLYSDGNLISNVPSVENLEQRVQQLWQAIPMMSIEQTTNNTIKIQGIISSHQHYRYDRSNIFFFVNQRWVKNNALIKALLKSYLNVLPEGRYPSAIVSLTIDPQEIDINIHPRKEEVQFLHERIVEQVVYNAVKSTLEKHLSHHVVLPRATEPSYATTFAPLKTTVDHTNTFPKNFSLTAHTASEQKFEEKFHYTKPYANSFAQQPIATAPAPIERHNNTLQNAQQQESFVHAEPYQFIGMYNNTYILAESPEGLVLIDQHAAHERILYEQFKSRFDTMQTIPLLFPAIITFSADEYALITEYTDILKTHGLIIESFGHNSIIVQSAPAHLKNISFTDLLKELLGLLIEHKNLDRDTFLTTIHEKIHAQMACKAAVKAGDELTQEQIKRLLNDLYATSNRFACPHGRPTLWTLHQEEIERKFKRKK